MDIFERDLYKKSSLRGRIIRSDWHCTVSERHTSKHNMERSRITPSMIGQTTEDLKCHILAWLELTVELCLNGRRIATGRIAWLDLWSNYV